MQCGRPIAWAGATRRVEAITAKPIVPTVGALLAAPWAGQALPLQNSPHWRQHTASRC